MNQLFFLLSFCFVSISFSLELFKCNEKVYEGAFKNQVCVCNATFCDEIEPIGELAPGKVVVYKSSLSGDRLRRITKKIEKYGRGDETVNVTILFDGLKKYQEIFGFGGAFTDAAGENLAALKPDVQDQLLSAYFGEKGIGYTVGRVPIASTDFSTHSYSYTDVPEDFDLKHFALTDEDIKLKIPFILKAKSLVNGQLNLFSSPWSAPGWMKTTGVMKGGGALRNDTRIYKAYAQYFLKFFVEYKKRGVDFWGVTIQNEPSTGADMTWKWQTMNYTAETMRDFLRDYLGPVLKNNTLTADLKVMILDDGRGLLPGWADTIFNDTDTSNLADGVAVHWYGNVYSSAVLLDYTHYRHPDKFIFGTEACTGYFGHHGPIMGDWFRAESYTDDIITDLNHFVTGWTDWNLCLDEIGGPNWALNVVDAPIIVNRTSQEFYKQPMFYAMGHFSKFLLPGSSRVDVKIKGSLAVVAVGVTINGGRRATVILNKGSNPLKAEISDVATGASIILDLEERSIHTVIWDKKKKAENNTFMKSIAKQ